MTTINITDQEKALLSLIAKGESSAGVDPYTSLWPGTSEPSLVQMTCAEVQRFQQQRLDQGHRSTACGRYQFIKKTLTEAIRVSGIDPLTTRYTPDIQDFLILSILKRYRKLTEWIAGTYTTPRFMIKLSQEFASIPVPYQMQGQSRIVNKGQSYYAGDGLNKAHHDADTLFSQLNDILNGGTGETTTINVLPSGPSGAVPELGSSPRTQVARSTAGTGVGAIAGQGRPGSQPLGSSTLPVSDAVYTYEVIDPLDDRYDFRTGRKVKDILIHGTSAAAATPHVEQNIGVAGVAGTNIGVVPPGITIPQPDPLDAFGGAGEAVGAVAAAAEAGVEDALDAFGGAGEEVGLSIEQLNQILEGNAPTQPTPEPADAPCPQPLNTGEALAQLSNRVNSGSRLPSANLNSNAFAGPGGNGGV